MAPSRNPGPDDTVAPVTVLATQLNVTLVVALSPGTNMVTGCSLDSEHPFGLWWNHEPLDINTDPGSGRTTDPVMVLETNLDLDITMGPRC